VKLSCLSRGIRWSGLASLRLVLPMTSAHASTQTKRAIVKPSLLRLSCVPVFALIALLTTHATAGAQLVGRWSMDEGSGATLVDGSGQGNNAAVIGSATWVPGQMGLGLNMGAVNGRALAPDSPSLDISSQITLATWVRPTQVTTQHLIKKAVNAATDGYELSLATSGFALLRQLLGAQEPIHG